MTEFEAALADEVPFTLVAVDLNVYAVALVNPVTVHEVAGEVTVQVAPPGDAVTVYEVGLGPVLGGTIVTVAEELPATAVGVPGVLGGLELITNDTSLVAAK